jgi:hypothetical protein
METMKITSQETFFLNLVRRANWTREQVEQLFQSKFETSYWNDLNQNEKRQAIVIMKHFVKKATELREKKLRQMINAIWIKAGYSRDELHTAMTNWGFGNSLRALNHKDLCNLIAIVKKALGENNENKKK